MLRYLRFAACLVPLLALPARADSLPPVAGAPDWRYLGLGTSEPCAIVDVVDGLDVIVMASSDGGYILSVGNRDWPVRTGTVVIDFHVDANPSERMSASNVATAVAFVMDAGEFARLHDGTTLSWHLPWGDFQVAPHDLGPALDALTACVASHPRPSGN